MWIYEKKLQYPVNIKQTNAQLAKAIITQYGGPDKPPMFMTLLKNAETSHKT